MLGDDGTGEGASEEDNVVGVLGAVVLSFRRVRRREAGAGTKSGVGVGIDVEDRAEVLERAFGASVVVEVVEDGGVDDGNAEGQAGAESEVAEEGAVVVDVVTEEVGGTGEPLAEPANVGGIVEKEEAGVDGLDAGEPLVAGGWISANEGDGDEGDGTGEGADAGLAVDAGGVEVVGMGEGAVESVSLKG
jgi:hypothetical protein